MSTPSGTSPLRASEARSTASSTGAIFSGLSTRSRILLLVFSSALPILVLSTVIAFEQREAAEARARAELQSRAQLAAIFLPTLSFDLGTKLGAALHGKELLSIFDDKGSAVAHFSSGAVRAEDTLLSIGALALITQSDAHAFEQTTGAGEVRLYAVRRVPTDDGFGTPLAVVVSVPKDAIYRDVDRALTQTLAGIAAVTLVLLLTAWSGAERLVLRPMRIMLEMTRRVRAGDLAARTGLQAGREELCQLGAALDEMAGQLQLRESKLRQVLEEFHEQAVTDSLTGLHNRRYFWEALAREVLTARRKHTPFSVILLDIDHFKRVNDTWGHDAGDIVLKQIAVVIRASVRGSDIAVRYGGEEFAMLLPDTAAEVARQRAEGLRRALAGLEIRHGSGTIRITASFGVAESTDPDDDGAALMRRADEAMYAAKNAGRNRVV